MKQELIKKSKELEEKVNFHYVTGRGSWRVYSALVETTTGPAKVEAIARTKQFGPDIKSELIESTDLTDVHYKETDCGTWALDYDRPDNKSDIKTDIDSGNKYYTIFEKLKDLVCMFDNAGFEKVNNKYQIHEESWAKTYNGGRLYCINPEKGTHAIPKGVICVDVKNLINNNQSLIITKYDGVNFFEKKYQTTVNLNFDKLVGI